MLNLSSNLTEYTIRSQAKVQKRLYYSTNQYKQGLVDRQRALKIAISQNYISPVLETLSGIRKLNHLKQLKYLINNCKHGFIRISNEKLARVLGINIRTVQRITRFLLDNGYITKIVERHTNKNRLPNMYSLLSIFQDKNLLSQLKNMYYENTFNNKIDTEEKFGVTPNNNKEIFNYSLLRNYKREHGSTQNLGVLLKECLINVGRDYEANVNRRPIPKKGKVMKWKELNDSEKERIRKFATPEVREDLILYRDHNKHPEKYIRKTPEVKKNNHMAEYLEQFKSGFVKQ